MAQVVQHNIMALNSYNKLSTNNSALSKNLEKLSSGYKINRAGDDAAGLAISEKMRAQITGLEKAATNAQDGISLVQTAEGALTEVHSMLNRMTELATQSANGTYQNDVDRENLQAEVDALLDEIDRIASSTNFNGINLLDGSAKAASVSGGSSYKLTLDLTSIDKTDGKTFEFGGVTLKFKSGGSADDEIDTSKTGDEIVAQIAAKLGASDEFDGYTVTVDSDKKTLLITGDDDAEANSEFEKAVGGTGGITGTGVVAEEEVDDGSKKAKYELDVGSTAKIANTKNIVIAGVTLTGKTSPATSDPKTTIKSSLTGNALATAIKEGLEASSDFDSDKYNVTVEGTKVIIEAKTGGEEGNLTSTAITGTDTTFTGALSSLTEVQKGEAGTTAGGTGTFSLQIGDTVSQRLTFSIASMDTKSLGIDTIDIGTEAGAAKAINTIKTAINTVSVTRAGLGAVQNRLEHTITNLETTTENLTNSESRIRDTDMAKEMMSYTQNNVLSQAAQAMLAQANQQPQQVLQLLQ